MAKTLAVLIKLAGRKVELAQRQLARTQQEIQAAGAAMRRLEEDAAVAFVQAVAEDDVLSLQAAGAVQEKARRGIAALKEEEAALRQREGEEKARLQAHYAEQKRYEILQERQAAAARKAQAKKAQGALDDVAGRMK